MNDRLIAEMLADAASQPAGKRMHRLIALVAERCATIIDIEVDADPASAARHAASTIRAAFVEATKFDVANSETSQPALLKPTAMAARDFVGRRDH